MFNFITRFLSLVAIVVAVLFVGYPLVKMIHEEDYLDIDKAAEEYVAQSPDFGGRVLSELSQEERQQVYYDVGQPLIKDSSNTLVVIQLVLIFTLGYMIGHSKARSFINQISSDEVMELFGCLGKIYKLVKGMIYIVLPGIIPTYWILLVAAAFYSPDYLLTRPMFIQKTIISIVMLAILFIIAYITYKVMMKAIKNNADAIYNKRSQKNKIIDLKKREKELAQQNKRSRNHYYDY